MAISYKKLLFPNEKKLRFLWLKTAWKWTKISLVIFLIASTIWGCGQIMADKTVMAGYIDSIYDNKKYNLPAVFFELAINEKNVAKRHIFHFVNDKLYEYKYNVVTSWKEAWQVTKSPFFGLFVYPIAYLLVNISKIFSGEETTSLSVILAILFTTLLIKLITITFTFKAQQNQEKMQPLQLKVAEIQAKYKYATDPNSKQQMQMEIMTLYRKLGVNPVSAFIPMFLSLPFYTAMFTVVRTSHLLKTTSVGAIKLIEVPWGMITSGNWSYLIIILIYAPIQITSVLIPMFLNKKKANKVKTNESKAAMRKQIMMQIIFIFVAILFVFATPAGLGIYGIINSTLQIIQTICFHYYNKYKKNKDKNEGIIQEPLIKKIKNIFKPRARNYQQNKK